jgi:hypothetical protein
MKQLKKQNPRRVRQFEKQICTLVDDNGGADRIFGNFKHRPSNDALIKMFLVGKFGGENPLMIAGVDFALELLLMNLMKCLNCSERITTGKTK